MNRNYLFSPNLIQSKKAKLSLKILAVIFLVTVLVSLAFIIAPESPTKKFYISSPVSSWKTISVSGLESNLSLVISNPQDKKADFCWYFKNGYTPSASEITDKSLYYSNGTCIKDDKNKCIVGIKYETSKCNVNGTMKNGFHLSLTEAQAVNINTNFKLGNTSWVESYQNDTKVVYETGKYNISSTLMKWNGFEYILAPDDIFINDSNANKLKYGAIDNSLGENQLAKYRYLLSSTAPSYEKEGWYYFYSNLSDLSSFVHTDFRDICLKRYEPYNVTYSSPHNISINRTETYYNKTANCSISRYSNNGTNYIQVDFLSDKYIDPSFGGGNGTSVNPYQVTNWTNLNETRDYLSSYFILMNNLSSATAGYSGIGDAWVPVGLGGGSWDCTTSFCGSFDGNRYTISDLKINRPTDWYVGLFGYGLSSVVIENLSLVVGNLAGPSASIGALAGYLDSGSTVLNCNVTVTGNISGGDSGGIVGYGYGTISNSNVILQSGASITGGNAGGLAGKDGGGLSFPNSYVIIESGANITGTDYAGGIIGQFQNQMDEFTYVILKSGSTIYGGISAGGLVGYVPYSSQYLGGGSYAEINGTVRAGTDAGGVVGYTDGSLQPTVYAVIHSAGKITGTNAGGVAGTSSSSLYNSYAIIKSGANITGTNVGGLVGDNTGVGIGLASIYVVVEDSAILSGSSIASIITSKPAGWTDGIPAIVKDSQFGNITFSDFNLTGTGNLLNYIHINNNSVYVNSSVSGLNKSATITLIGLSTNYINPKIYRDGTNICNSTTEPSCNNFTSLNAGTVRFDVSSWSNYSIGGDPNTAPNTTQVILNSTNPALNDTNQNLTCYANITDVDGGNVSANYTWYKNGVTNLSGQSSSFAQGTLALVATLYKGNLSVGQNWTCSVKAYDSTDYEDDWTNSSNITILSPSDTTPPNGTLIFPINGTLNKTSSQNFTVNVTDETALGNATLNIYQHLGSLVNSTFYNIGGGLQATIGIVVNLVDGVYDWFYQIFDSAGNSFTTQNNTLTIDSTNPSVNSLTFNPTSPATYSTSLTIQLNATINDTNGINTVLLEFNGINYTVTNLSIVYTKSFSGLSAGSYNYRWFANDTLGNVNNTASGTYTIDKADSGLGMNITGTTPIEYPTVTDIAYSENNTGDGDCVYSIDKTNIVYGVGTVTFNYSTAGCTNYSAGSKTKDIIINKNSSLVLGISGTTPINYGTITNVVGGGCPTELTCTLSPSNAIYGVGTVTFNYSTPGNENYTATSITKDIVINAIPSEVKLYLNNTEDNLTIINPTSVYINATRITGEGQIQILKDSVIINLGDSPLFNLTTFGSASLGYYNYTAYYPATQNYTASFKTFFLNVSDITNPNATLLTPSNGTIINLNQNHTVNLTDNFGIKNATLNIYNSTGIVNQTTTVFGADILNSVVGVVVDLTDGIYNWFYNVFDWGGNSFTSQNNTLTIDKTVPTFTISLIPSTAEYGVDTVRFNWTASDIHLDTAYFNLTNSSGYLFENKNTTRNTTYLPSYFPRLGAYTFIIWANDTANNSAASASYLAVVTVADTTPPKLNITSPINGGIYSGSSVQLNITVNASDISNLSRVWWSYNLTTNITLNATNNNWFSEIESWYQAVGSTDYNITICANDTVGNENCTVLAITWQIPAAGGAGGGGFMVQEQNVTQKKSAIIEEAYSIWDTAINWLSPGNRQLGEFYLIGIIIILIMLRPAYLYLTKNYKIRQI